MAAPVRVRTLRLRWSIASIPLARRHIAQDLADVDLADQIVTDTQLVVTELLANAMKHGRPMPDGRIRVYWRVRSGRVEFEVEDGGGDTEPAPVPHRIDSTAASGRGLRLVRSIADEWGVEKTETGTTVWVSLGGPSRRRSQ